MTQLRRGVCLGLFAIVVACAAARAPDRRDAHVGRPLVLAVPDLGGGEVDVGAADGKVHVVDFWATWCEPCKEAMPMLDAMARELRSRGLEVVGISVDEDRARVIEYLRERPVGFRILWDKGAVRLVRLGVTLMPVTYLVDRHGIVRYVHQGWDEARGRRQRQQVEALLAEP